MSKKLPQTLAIVFAAFVSVFALDVFGEGYGPVETVVALLIHLVPTYLILVALLVARKNERPSAAFFSFFLVYPTLSSLTTVLTLTLLPTSSSPAPVF